MRVLVAEDDPKTQKALIFLLQRHGYTATAALDGQAALDLLTEPDAPTIVLLDWEMPKLNGLDVCRLLRAMPLPRYIYVIMVTARDSAADLLAAFAAGADDFLGKPADTAELLARVKSGERVLALENRLEERIAELRESLDVVSQLKRLLCQIEERGTWRFERPLRPHPEKIEGGWFGIDYGRELCAGCAFLSDKKLTTAKARAELARCADFFARPLK